MPAAEIPSTHRLRPIFRDDDELAASADLGGRLREALDRSRYLRGPRTTRLIPGGYAAAGSTV
jgi:hypothetical protein